MKTFHRLLQITNVNTHRNYEMVENYAVQLIQEAIQLAAMCKKARAV